MRSSELLPSLSSGAAMENVNATTPHKINLMNICIFSDHFLICMCLYHLSYLLTSPTVFASDISFGPELATVINDPFLQRYIFGVNVAKPVFSMSSVDYMIHLAYSPDLGKTDWRPLTTELVEGSSISPDLSKIIGIATFSLSYDLFTLSDGIFSMDFAAIGGLGMVRTNDDLESLQKEGDPQAISTQNQFHSAVTGGFLMNIQSDTLKPTLMISMKSCRFIETIDGTTLEMKNNLIFGVSSMYVFGGS